MHAGIPSGDIDADDDGRLYLIDLWGRDGYFGIYRLDFSAIAQRNRPETIPMDGHSLIVK